MERYEELRGCIVAMLQECERVKEQGQKGARVAQKIGNPLGQEFCVWTEEFDKLMKELLRLEQETREI